MATKYYAVKHGRVPGIYQSWPECQQQVNGFPNARFKSFTSIEAAQQWLNNSEGSASTVLNMPISAIHLYTDGGSRNHGNKLGQHVKANDKAAWAYLIITTNNHRYEGTAGEWGATNNRMEVLALINALKRLLSLHLQDQIIIATLDSHYVLDPLTKGWLTSWQRRGWKTASGKPVANRELWQQLLQLVLQFKHLQFDWTKGHANNVGNNRVDELLNQTMDQMKEP